MSIVYEKNSRKTPLVEILFRYDEPEGEIDIMSISLDDYFSPFSYLAFDDFNGAFHILEWVYLRTKQFGGKSERSIRRHDVVKILFRDKRMHDVSMLVIDKDKDKNVLSSPHSGPEQRAEGVASLCPLSMVPLKINLPVAGIKENKIDEDPRV